MTGVVDLDNPFGICRRWKRRLLYQEAIKEEIMEKKSIVGFVSKIEKGETKKGAPMWSIRIDADSFKLFEKHRATVKYLETMKADGKPVEVILIKKDDSAYFNFEDESEARPAPDGFLEVAQAPRPENRRPESTNQSIEGQVAAKIVSECLQAKIPVSPEIEGAFWQWIGQRLAPGTTIEAHQAHQEAADGPSEEKVDPSPCGKKLAISC